MDEHLARSLGVRTATTKWRCFALWRGGRVFDHAESKILFLRKTSSGLKAPNIFSLVFFSFQTSRQVSMGFRCKNFLRSESPFLVLADLIFLYHKRCFLAKNATTSCKHSKRGKRFVANLHMLTLILVPGYCYFEKFCKGGIKTFTPGSI